MYSDSVKEFIRKEVPDWDDEVMATARFKAFSGQRTDWEPKLQFWRDLILKISRQFGLLIIQPSLVKNVWFNRGGLTPLCIDQVLFLMYNEGDIMPIGDLVDPGSGRLSQLARKMRNLMARSTMTPEKLLEDRLVITPLIKDKASEVIKLLSESHWTSSCVVTMKKFREMCGGSDEASAVLSYLSGCGKAKYFSLIKKELMEGVKVCLLPAAVPSISSLDCDVLHLVWTVEKLGQQLHVIDQRYEVSKKSALASLKSGNKSVALRYARELKLASKSREKYMSMLNRVDEVLNVIAESESTKKVSEAIKIGAQAMRENKISVDEVHFCLEELQETIESQKEVEKALELSPYPDIGDEDIEEEFSKLELELESELPREYKESGSTSQRTEASESVESLVGIFSNLNLANAPAEEQSEHSNVKPSKKEIENPILEAA